MKLNKFLVVILITIFVSASFTFLFYSFYYIQDIKELDMKMKVGDYIGIDVNSSVISFGTVRKGTFSNRPVTLENKEEIPLKVQIKKSGEMAAWVSISDNNFILKPAEKKNLTFTATRPIDAINGAYKGKVKLIFTRVI